MLGNNHFQEEFEAFKASSYFQLLDQKFKPIPYYKKYKHIYRLTYLVSYIFNGLSGVTAIALVLLFLIQLTNNWYLSVGSSILGIVVLEILKRKLSSIVFKEWLVEKKYFLMPILVLLLTSGSSVLSSYHGSRQMVIQLSSSPEITQQDVSVLENELQYLDKQIEAARNTTWRGITTTVSQATIKELTAQRTRVLNQIFAIQDDNRTTTNILITNHQNKVHFQAKYVALVTLLLEILFWVAAFYLEYYDYRSYVEFHRASDISNEPKNEPVNKIAATNPQPIATVIDPTILQAAMKNARANLAAYHSKLKNGQGTVAANQKGIRRWEARLRELDDLLPKNGTDKKDTKSSDNGVPTLF